MPLPDSVETVTLRLYDALHADGTPRRGSIIITPAPAAIITSGDNAVFAGPVSATYDGTTVPGPLVLVATDSASITPIDWTYTVQERWYDAPSRSYPIALPAAEPDVDLAAIAPVVASDGTLVPAAGPPGPQGEQGPAGATGATGPPGATGATGPQGTAGATGAQGPQGNPGATGATGAQGPKGDTGNTGTTGATGSTGAAGTNGTAVLNGSGSPSSGTGANGDFYIDTSGSGFIVVWGPKASGSWPGSGIKMAATPKITVASSAPSSPATGDVWIDTT
ncbi:collagen-like protein [Kitasatospora sp. NBC_00070]|uniref:hypothetical protein n=1 Tax=Kitasatospora sp. NBC_00070 TaxID=2975962 RepID=UPI00324A7309